MGMGTVTEESYQNYIYVNDKTLGPTVDPSRLQGPPGSSPLVHHMDKSPLAEVFR